VLGIVTLSAAQGPAAAADGDRPRGVAAVVITIRAAADDIAGLPVGAAPRTALLIWTADLTIRTGDTPTHNWLWCLIRGLILVLLRLLNALLLLVTLELLALLQFVIRLGTMVAVPAEHPGQQTPGKATHGGAPRRGSRERSREIVKTVLVHESS
jgi:hypothetical protein